MSSMGHSIVKFVLRQEAGPLICQRMLAGGEGLCHCECSLFI